MSYRTGLGSVAALGMVLTGCGGEKDPAADAPVLTVQPPAQTATATAAPEDRLLVLVPLEEGDDFAAVPFEQRGTVEVEVDVARLTDGQLTVEQDEELGAVWDFPDYTGDAEPPRAIASAVPDSDPDPLSPGESDFRYGATFTKDAESKGSAVDNGDNLVQRGLASDASQFKLELDDDHPRCQVKGSEGTLGVRSEVEVRAGVWYSVECERRGDALRVTVIVDPRGAGDVHTAEKEGPIGELDWTGTPTPIAVGGKLAADGSVIRTATDQFNGLMTRAWVDVDDG